MKNDYYLGKDGKIYSGRVLIDGYYLAEGVKIREDLLDNNLDKFKGIVTKIEPTVEDFLKSGQAYSAIQFYYNQANAYDPENPNKKKITIIDARVKVREIAEKLGYGFFPGRWKGLEGGN